MKVKTLLISQPKPEGDKSPFLDLAKKCNVKIDFRPFIHIEPVSAQDFRKEKINILDYNAVIMTSRSAVDHYFRMCQEMRITVPETMKYFCISESTAFYLQKYVLYRKRKIFYGKQTILDLMDVVKKHKDDNFLLPCTDMHKEEIADVLEQYNIKFSKAIMYRTVASDLSDLANVNYDVLVFFSPTAMISLYKNFPKFKQNNTRIACFGSATAQAIDSKGLALNIHAPTPQAPSMAMALEQYINNAAKGKVLPVNVSIYKPVEKEEVKIVVKEKPKAAAKVVEKEKVKKLDKTKTKSVSQKLAVKPKTKKSKATSIKTSKKPAKKVKAKSVVKIKPKAKVKVKANSKTKAKPTKKQVVKAKSKLKAKIKKKAKR